MSIVEFDSSDNALSVGLLQGIDELIRVCGAGTLKRFVTADELHTYLQASMPWWNPGSLSDEQAWELTALLLRHNGALPETDELDVRQAALLPVHVPIRDPQPERTWALAFSAALALTALGAAALRTLPETPASPTGSALQVGGAARRAARRPSFFHHLHPPSIPLYQARWRYTLGAGGLAVFAREAFMKGTLFKMGEQVGIADRDLLARVALKWVLAVEEVTAVVVGADTPAQLANSVAVLEDPALDAEERAIVERVKTSPTYASYAAQRRAQFGY